METKRLFKRFLFIGVMLFTSHVGSSNGVLLYIQAPVDQDREIDFYCVEYRKEGETTWTQVSAIPNTSGEGETTAHYLTDLESNTRYYVRVHAAYLEDGVTYWGEYGEVVSFVTLIDGGIVEGVYVQCGRMRYVSDVHDELTVDSSNLLVFERVLFKEEE